jgi:hypothetical protein
MPVLFLSLPIGKVTAMGQLRYSDTTMLDIDDDTLAHYQVIILRKLRLHESFALPWRDEATKRRTTVWIHPQSNLAFAYTSPNTSRIDPVLIRILQEYLDATGTLRLPPRPTEPFPAGAVDAVSAVPGTQG